ncbi:MAG: hypothetical protein HYV75_02670 [Opitutae bacterium]|nr:hypothetical protein [Opitutae bacterium]
MSSLQKVCSQPSWRIGNRQVEAFITELGGHLGPVTFRCGGRKAQPLAVAPWHAERFPALPPVLRVLRGDFFCLPFGGNDTAFRGERHPPHGETANSRWRCMAEEPDHLHLRLQTRCRPGQVDKHVWVRRGHTAIYQRHVVSGMSGPMDFGHHATLHFPDAEGSGLISTSPFAWGEVSPLALEDPRQRGYSRLQPGGVFHSLRKVPAADGKWCDLSAYPARRGYEDLVMLVGAARRRFAWTAVSFPAQGFAWFALKDPRVLTNTVLWHSNGGRHYPPWNGRHLNVLGLEEVTSYFHYGLAESARPNPISAQGGVTCRTLSRKTPLVVNYIMAVVPIPRGFDAVAGIQPLPGGRGVRLVSHRGRKTECPLALSFLTAGCPGLSSSPDEFPS